ncbi:MAG: DUF1501 domain-containing protein [Planctomycetaceae bacterium]|nr:DUF1501 domain-containing protein [Planctomycetaceae bacterium]
MLNTPRINRRCDGVTRRDFVSVGGLTALGLGVADRFRLQTPVAASERSTRSHRSCILIWLDGGPSHLETFDLKPDAPAEVRGPFQPISTAVAGTQICELLPLTAQLLDRVAIVRSMTSPLGEHNFGAQYLLSGYKPSPVIDYPSFGSVVAHLHNERGILPNNVAIPTFRVGGGRQSGQGFLPEQTRPFSVGGDPAKPDFQVRDLDLYADVATSRLDRRRSFLNAFDQFHRGAEQLGEASETPTDPAFEQAYRLVTSPDAKQAFDLTSEPAEVRKRYGTRTIGQSCLLARRLVERGVPFVTVNNPGWDTHQGAYTRLKEGYTGAKVPVGLIPSLDMAFSALVEDLEQRGLLDETLIVVMGEFGRTPKLNVSGGRDHWPRVFSVAMAGGGVTGGQVIGSSDSVGEGPKDRPVTPSDLACTIYDLLGIDPQHMLHTPGGRPIQVNRDGQLIRELIS